MKRAAASTTSSITITWRGRSIARFAPIRFSLSADCRFALIEGEHARRIVDAVEQRLLTPIGLRSLAPGEPGYQPHYGGEAARATARITREPCGRG